MKQVESIAGVNSSNSLNVMYFCPFCGSHDIQPIHNFGQKSYLCGECGNWEAWNLRRIISRYDYHKGRRPTLKTNPFVKKNRSWLDKLLGYFK